MIKEKTTWAAIVGAAGFIVLLVLLITKVLDATGFAAAVGSWAGAVATFIGIVAQDRNKQQ